MQAEIAELLGGRDRFEAEILTPRLEAYVEEQVAAGPFPACRATCAASAVSARPAVTAGDRVRATRRAACGRGSPHAGWACAARGGCWLCLLPACASAPPPAICEARSRRAAGR